MLTIGCHMSVAKGFEKMGLTALYPKSRFVQRAHPRIRLGNLKG